MDKKTYDNVVEQYNAYYSGQIPIKLERYMVTPANVTYRIITNALQQGDLQAAIQLAPLLTALLKHEEIHEP